jgi:hypothetical protein
MLSSTNITLKLKDYPGDIINACGTSNQLGIIGVIGASDMYSSLNQQLSQRVTQSISDISGQINSSIASSFPNISIVTDSQLTDIQKSRNQTQSADFKSTLAQVSNATDYILQLTASIAFLLGSSSNSSLKALQSNGISIYNQTKALKEQDEGPKMRTNIALLKSDSFWNGYVDLWNKSHKTQSDLTPSYLSGQATTQLNSLSGNITNISSGLTAYLFYDFLPCQPVLSDVSAAVTLVCDEIVTPYITVICAFGFYLFLSIFIVIYGLKLNCLWRTPNSYKDYLDDENLDDDLQLQTTRYNRRDLMDDSNGHDLMGPTNNNSRAGVAVMSHSMASAPVYAPPHPQLAGHFAAGGPGAPPPAMAPAVYATGSVSRSRSNAPALIALQPMPGHPPTYTQVILASPDGTPMRPTYVQRHSHKKLFCRSQQITCR